MSRCVIFSKWLVKCSLPGHGHRAESLGRGLYLPTTVLALGCKLWLGSNPTLLLTLPEPQFPLPPHVNENSYHLAGTLGGSDEVMCVLCLAQCCTCHPDLCSIGNTSFCIQCHGWPGGICSFTKLCMFKLDSTTQPLWNIMHREEGLATAA